MTEKLAVRLLGDPDLCLGGEAISGFVSNKARALVFYLAATGGPHSREVLAGLLWSHVPDSAARKNLRDVLANLRKLIGPYLVITRRTVSLHAGAPCWVDSQRLSAAVQAAQRVPPPQPAELLDSLAQAVDLYQGEFLTGFYVSDAPLFEDWVLMQREQLGRELREALGMLANGYGARSEYKAAISYAQRCLALDPLQESVHRSLIAFYAQSGDRAAALRQYGVCVQVLAEELEVEPSPRTAELAERIRQGDLLPTVLSAEIEELPPAPGVPPFKGLRYFDVADADLFFGREILTAELVGRLRRSQFLAVLGASGSGKSSLVRAGLVPALRRAEALADGTHPPPGCEGWPVHVLTPTAHPLEALALSLTQGVESVTAAATLADDLARDPRSLRLYVQRSSSCGGDRLLLVVDQFEELFTLSRDLVERQAFIDALLAATAGPALLIITLRADFYHHCAQFENLRRALERQQIYIGSMTADELRRAIEEPAERGDWAFEPGLVDLMLRDVGGEPGALPLLSHALLETWRRRRGCTLTLGGYHEAGGVHGAIAKSAEAVYQQLDPEQQAVARKLFLRLTELGEGAQDTRRRVARSELLPQTEDKQVLEEVLKTLADARLITTEKETVEVAHEALIREWPTLREWLEGDREGLRVHRHLTEAALEWERMDRDPGELYRGSRLVRALELAQEHPAELNPQEQDFLAASEERAAQQEAEQEARRQRELEAAHQLARERSESAARLRRRARYLVGALLVMVALAIAAALFGREAQQQRGLAERRARAADARELTGAAISNLEVDPELSVLLALQAVNETYLVDGSVQREAVEALHRAVQSVRSLLTIAVPYPAVNFALFDPGGTRLIIGGFSELERAWMTWVYDGVTGEHLQTHPDTIPMLVDPTGNRLAILVIDRGDLSNEVITFEIVDADSWEPLSTAAIPIEGGEITDIRFDADLERVVISFSNGITAVWDLEVGQLIVRLGTEGRIHDFTAAFSPDGERLATGDNNGIITVWDLTHGERPLTLAGESPLFQPGRRSPGNSQLGRDSENLGRGDPA